MPSQLRLLAGGLVLVLVAGLGWALWGRDDDPSARTDGKPTKVRLPDNPAGTGKDEPDRTRVYVDNTGQQVSVSVRTPRKPWTKRLKIDVNGAAFTLTRKGAPQAPQGCRPRVVAEPSSLLTRITVPRTCVDKSRVVRASVSVDGDRPVTRKQRLRQRPNVLMIMVDDMRTDELKWMPNVQKLLADRGVTFTNGFASFPLCCPARASVMTGQYPHNHGVWSHTPPWGFSSLDDSDTMPVWLNDSGYRTTYLGKYLNGYGSMPEPGRSTGTSTQYVPRGWDLWRGSIDGGLPAGDPNEGSTYRFYDTTLNDNGNGYVPLKGEYQTHAYARLGNEMNAESAATGKPFFSYVSFTAPHHGGPAEADDPPDLATPARPRALWGAFDKYIKKAPGSDWKDPDLADKPEIMQRQIKPKVRKQIVELARQRAEALYVVDQSVKKLVNGLKKSGAYKNTVIAFTSDNGYFLGEQGRPEGKILPYEPSLRVPLVMAGPGIPRGEVRTDPFLSVDYASTFADLADARPSKRVDGRSMLDVARLGDESAGDTWSRIVLTETNPNPLVTRQVKRRQPVGARPDGETLRGFVTGIRTGDFLYTEWDRNPRIKDKGIEVELYDLRQDPNQYRNLAVDSEYDELVEQLHGVLVKQRECRQESCRGLLPEDLR